MDYSDASLDEFTLAFIEALLHAESLDGNSDIRDISLVSLEQIRRECAAFQANAQLLLDKVETDSTYPLGGRYSVRTQAGHDFLLTRNHHGAGFWDGDWPDEIGDALTTLSHLFPEIDLYIGDDGRLYVQ